MIKSIGRGLDTLGRMMISSHPDNINFFFLFFPFFSFSDGGLDDAKLGRESV